MGKITISEFEKILKKIDKNVEVVKGDNFDRNDYYIKVNSPDTYLYGFNLGTFDSLNLCFGRYTYDRDISDKVLDKAIKLIPYTVPDDYKEPTEEELFEEFREEVEEKGFYLKDRGSGDYVLKFDSRERWSSWIIATFNRDLKCCNVISNVDAPIDKYLEGLKLFINYVEKVKALEPIILYEIPLPGLKTTDGQQQYLSDKDGVQFASRKNNELKQTWTEKELINVPKAYREYVVEVEE